MLNLKFNTAVEIIRLLERYNLSDTSEDVKGIAFERFLGRTFRGEIGQFFTPRTIVEFMIRMLGPHEGEAICDPASGSGGFLIRFFELVREQILEDADRQYEAVKEETEARMDLSEEEKAAVLREEYDRIQQSIDLMRNGSRTWSLANRCIYGTDANERMARTSKMNMIMHGDGHGGVHHHNGFLNVNGIFEERFDIVLTNPPFGAKVEKDDEVLNADVHVTGNARSRYEQIFGDVYREARSRTEAAVGEAIASLFDLGHSAATGNLLKQKTEILFIERCLDLLKPGGRLGIVLPEGILNNPEKHHRRSIRLPDYDYRRPGAYFVTVCAHEGLCLFGAIAEEQMVLSDYGKTVIEEWHRTEALRDNVQLDAFVVMPNRPIGRFTLVNHVHGIIVLVPPGTQGDADPHGYRAFAHSTFAPDEPAADGTTVGAQRRCAPTNPTTNADRNGRVNVAPRSLGAIVRGFKSAATRRINRRRGTPGGAVWQRNYYEHILRPDRTGGSTLGVRHERAWHACRRYIEANPRRWPLDACHPARTNAADVPAGGPRL